MTAMFALYRALQKLIRDDSGQSLVVVISSMTVLMGIAAFGIDAATWMAKHHQAQVVADSAALAAAHCLANPGAAASSIVLHGTKTTVPSCTSSSDATDADQVAIDYAAANGLTITDSNVTISGSSVKVRAPATSGGVFSKVAGISSASQSAAAGAGWTSSSGVCSTPGTGCDFIFAENSNCTNTTNGVDLNLSGNATVQGDIQSNGNLYSNTSGTISLGVGSYGPNTNGTCKATTNWSGSQNPWATPPTQSSTDYPFPIDYTKDFPACGGTGDPCESNGYPSFCTNSGPSITLTASGSGDVPVGGNIYCASGTGTPSTPSTWNGSVTINVSGNYTWYDTFVGGTITYNVSGNEALSSCGYTTSGYSVGNCSSSVPAPVTGNYPIFYATGTSSTAMNLNISGGQTLNGDVFAPNGGAYLNLSGNKTLVTCIEGNNVTGNVSGTFQGDGPAVGPLATGGGGTVSLTQ